MIHARTILALVLGLAACSDLNVSTGHDINYAVFNFAGTPSDGQVQVRPEGIFFRAPEGAIAGSGGGAERCVDVAVTTPGTPNVRNIAGGDSVIVTVGSAGVGTLPLKPTSNATQSYLLPGGTFLMAGGSRIRVETVGAASGFPAMADSVTSAEPFTMSPITDSIDVVEGGLPITWTAAPSGGSTMVVTLKYATAGGSVPNRQVLCTFADDGSAVIDRTFATGYINADPASRANSASRIRTRFKQVGDNLLVLASSYDITVPNATPASAAVAK